MPEVDSKRDEAEMTAEELLDSIEERLRHIEAMLNIICIARGIDPEGARRGNG